MFGQYVQVSDGAGTVRAVSSARRTARHQPSRVDRIVIVGAGDCGTRAALAVRAGGWTGELTLIGDEPVAPYERPPLSKAVLVSDDPPPPITSGQQLGDVGIIWQPGIAAKGVDRSSREVVLDDGRRVGFDRLLIATGARARRPALAGPAAVMTLRSLADAAALRTRLESDTRLLVIGGGFIGLEVAASAITRGCTVTVIEFAHRLMSRVVPAKVAEIVQVRHLEAGVDLRCGIGVDRIEPRGNAYAVVLTDQSVVIADVIMAGVGAVPNTELASTAGLSVSNGICVDAQLRTEDPAIMAAGDCCSFPHPLYGDRRVRIEAWRNALDHADLAARNLLGDDAVCDTVPWFWSDQYELGIQIAGLHDEAAYDVVRRRNDGTEMRFGLDNDGRIVSASGVSAGSSISRDMSLAAILIGQRAAPRPTELADAAVSLRQLANAAP